MNAQEIVGKVRNLPPVSQAALRLVTLLDQPAISNEEIVEVLKCDNVLTAKLLRACNSPFFGLEEPVASVDQAVFLLGHQQILHIVLSLAFGGAMSVVLPRHAMETEDLWRHSVTTAQAAETILDGGLDLDVEPSVAFTVGLLHDLGKLVLAQVLTAEQQAEIRARVALAGMSRSEAEQDVIGTDHAEVGGELLRAWRLPESLVEGVRHHHRPRLDDPGCLSVVAHVANVVAHRARSDAPVVPGTGLLDPAFQQHFNLDEPRLDELTRRLQDQFEKIEHLMRLG
ncbi:HDOD domain-containing protein [Limisphaera sp. 4302-co]|uniref:HDOD domain-containing protein n=1 Tax=Limisphaera sp. 4302-co TaxID=3400417 RepID=UPI003C15C17D